MPTLKIDGRWARMLLLPALLAGGASAAGAQDHPTPEALRATYAMAACMVKDSPAQARRMLAYAPGSQESLRAFFAAQPGNCLSEGSDGEDDALRLEGPFQRGAVAEYLLLRDFSAIGVPKGKIGPVFVLPGPAEVAKFKPWAQQILAGLAVAECVVRAEPRKSFAVFGTRVESPEEKAALTALLPAVDRCVPAGRGIDMEMASLRALLGEAAYRVSVQLTRKAAE
ncbi:MAG TPA: hypothetical protein VFW19_18565 [Allosphingosinicella sp.]|nr:hypothetical protein [Allosphingosinicella sp.]